MSLEIGQIYSVKMNSGEEIVFKLVEIGSGSLTISNPVSIGPNPKGGLGLMPSMFTVNIQNNLSLNTNSIAIGPIETDESVRVKYIEVTTGLTVPEKKILAG